jgi:hypothetical protein
MLYKLQKARSQGSILVYKELKYRRSRCFLYRNRRILVRGLYVYSTRSYIPYNTRKPIEGV